MNRKPVFDLDEFDNPKLVSRDTTPRPPAPPDTTPSVPATPASPEWTALTPNQQELLVAFGAEPPADYQSPPRCTAHVKNYRDFERDIWEPTSCREALRADNSCPGAEWHIDELAYAAFHTDAETPTEPTWQPGDPIYPPPGNNQIVTWCRGCDARWYGPIQVCPECERIFTVEDRLTW